MSAPERTWVRLPRRPDQAAGTGSNGHREQGRSPRRRRRVLYVIAALVVAVVVFFGLNAVYGFTAGSPSATGARLTATVKRGTVQSSVSASGNLTEAKSASANFATSGTITKVYASVGEHVNAGQALAKIDPTSARNALAAAEANLATAETTLTSAKGGLTTAQLDANTVSVQQAQQAVTTDEQQLGTDQTALATARAQLARDAKLGFPASTTASGSASTGTGSASTGTGSASTGTGSASTGTGSASTGTGSASPTNNTLSVENAGSTSATGTGSAAVVTGPTVVTGSASAVGTSSATLGGSVTPGGLDTTYYFVYGTSPTSLSATTPTTDAGSSATGSVPASVTVSGLVAGQNYYFELVASNSSGTTDGSVALFTTASATATAATGQASAIGSTTATLTGSVNPGALDTSDYFQYGTSAASLSSSSPTFNDGAGSGTVSVTATVHNLQPDTTYWFRVVATNSSGTNGGVEETFTTTAADKPTVVTSSASGALTASVALSGSVNPNGSDTKYWFEYGTTMAYGSKTKLVDAGAGITASQVSATLTGLKPDTQYVFRLLARNKFGTSTGLGEFVTTASSSKAADEQAVTTDEQTLQRQEATVETAKVSLQETEASIASSETPSTSTIEQDQATVSEDEATVSSDRQALDQTVLRAPIGGTVTAEDAAVGQTISAGSSTVSGASASSSSSTGSSSTGLGAASTGGSSSTGSSTSGSGLFTIDSLGQLEIVAGFAEADATNIAVGQPVTITFPALTNTEVAGRVVAVSLTSTVVSSVVTYDETIALINPPSNVKEGMTADASVVVQTVGNALYVPSAAITTTGTVSTVEVLKNGKETQQRVTTGLVGNSDSQIISGLTAGEVLVEPTVSVASTGAAATSSAGGGFPGGGSGGFTGGGGFGGGGGIP
jgi:macrolide-specific efflux system membrane fusion protein